VVANGPSVHNFDLFSLHGKTVLAVNEASFLLEALGLATVVFSLDNRWIHRRRDFLERFVGEKYLAVPLETWPECGGISGAIYLQWSYEKGLSDDPGIVCTGGNSGYGAINVAYLKHAKTIYLVGFDMDPSGKEEFEQWIPRFRTMLPQLEAHRVRVLNLNPNSHVDAFPFA